MAGTYGAAGETYGDPLGVYGALGGANATSTPTVAGATTSTLTVTAATTSTLTVSGLATSTLTTSDG